MDLRADNGDILTVYIDVFDNSLSRKWVRALKELVQNDFHLEKNYCWFGWTQSQRNAEYICGSINSSINAINRADLGYRIDCASYDIASTINDDFIAES